MTDAAIDLGDRITIERIWSIAAARRAAAIGSAARDRMARSADCLTRMIEQRRRLYGVTTGYGPLAGNYVMPELGRELQRHLIYHLATGVGAPLSATHTRAVMAARLRTLAIGHSGVGDAVATLLLACLNQDILPVIPSIGTVGASGDLTPLAHIALALIGEGPVVVNGRVTRADLAFAEAGLTPVALAGKDGLALVNGTAAMTGISAINATRARRAADFGLRLAAFYAELMGGHGEAFDPRLGEVRAHPGQIAAHRALAALLAGGARLVDSIQPPPVLDDADIVEGVQSARELPQDPYSIRCLPQIFGAIFDVFDFHDQIVDRELNAVTDNPIVFAADDTVLHGGNFYGQHVAFAADTAALGVLKLAIHAERCLARLTDVATNRGLPAFLHGGRVGLNSGLMGAQVTATALIAEMRIKALPASVQSIPTNANNQDVVTLGTLAARKTAELLDLAWSVLAIQAIAVAQARDLLADKAGFSASSERVWSFVRESVPPMTGDRALAAEITDLAHRLEWQDWSPPG